MKFTNATLSALLGTLSLVNNISYVEGNTMKLRSRESLLEDKRILAGGTDSGMVFSRGYVCIIKQQDFAFIIPTQKSKNANFENLEVFDALNLLGTSIIQSGGIYDPADVQIVDQLSGSSGADELNRNPQIRFQFSGQRQPKFIPQADPGFFFNGECVATNVNGGRQILGHSCLLNLCLGGGGYNCLAIYAGTKFAPDYGSFVPNLSFPDDSLGRKLVEPVVRTSNINQFVPQLPPSYPGTIIGGTGLFNGAVGYVDITTITGSTIPPIVDGDIVGGERDEQAGYITQKINVVTNIPLPVAP